MNEQNNRQPQTQTRSAGTEESVQISLPRNEEVQTGPFEHSGETSRQTEESKEEEEAQKTGE